jgi:proline dehydrogenase
MNRYSEIKKATAEVVNIRIVRKSNTAKAHAAIRDVIVANPTLTYEQIADLLACSRWLVYTVAVEFNIRRPRGAGATARRKEGL